LHFKDSGIVAPPDKAIALFEDANYTGASIPDWFLKLSAHFKEG
jgi:hypothetical protein